MCRLVGYLGPEVSLHDLLVGPPHSLEDQAWRPVEQVSGSVNADGFGVGWYDLDRRPEPAVHRTTKPMWADRSFHSFAGLVTSTAVVGAVRGATPPSPVEESGTQPFEAEQWLFAHNGAVERFREGAATKIRRLASEVRESAILGASDSEIIFAVVLTHLDAGATPAEALAVAVDAVSAVGTARLNLVLTDGRTMAATRYGDSLHVAVEADLGRTVVASEPFDHYQAWQEVPDGSVLEATAGHLTIDRLP